MRSALGWVLRRLRIVVLLALLAAPALADVIQEQRARLPPAATCQDPVAGIWRSHAFYPHVLQWYTFTLAIGRVPDNPAALTGTMHAVYWDGTAEVAAVPPCAAGLYRKAVFEPATGSLQGMRVVFDASSWTPSTDGNCGEPESSYSLDHFSGTIDPERQEFQSVLNAPGWSNVPQVFRRVRCTDAPAAPALRTPLSAPVAPPPPPPRAGGCGCPSTF